MAKRSTKIQQPPPRFGWQPIGTLQAPVEQLVERFPPGLVIAILDHRAKMAKGRLQKQEEARRLGGVKSAATRTRQAEEESERIRAIAAEHQAGSRRKLPEERLAELQGITRKRLRVAFGKSR